jgi:hypothetical protein
MSTIIRQVLLSSSCYAQHPSTMPLPSITRRSLLAAAVALSLAAVVLARDTKGPIVSSLPTPSVSRPHLGSRSCLDPGQGAGVLPSSSGEIPA